MKLIWAQSRNIPSAPLSLTADCCAAVEGLALPCGVYVTLTDDEQIQTINRAQRGIDRATDVLSFPSVNYPKSITAHKAKALIKQEYSDDDRAYILGDIFISYDHVLAQAEEYGHSVDRELCYLLTHGLFHLFGYDHMTGDEQKEMRNMEEKALQLAGITRGGSVAAPVTDAQLLALAKEAMQRSYSPYSHYKVGACLLSLDGRVYTGTNIENASFGLTICAERAAISKAITDGAQSFSAIAIAAVGSPPWPCGACRQVLNEFGPDIRVLITWDKDQTDEAPLSALLPHSFGPKDLP
ncbi:MAG TPA: cytidine deaminase [Candidatus Limiplasma sp.]|nr:cytidine deaminase [Candidatus Limiplasma sp.]